MCLLALAQPSQSVPPCTWSPWLDRDDPGGHCDCETLADLVRENHPGACENPLALQARRRSDQTPVEALAGSVVFRHYNTDVGFTCFNSDQAGGRLCEDYEVRMCCPEPAPGNLIFATRSWTL